MGLLMDIVLVAILVLNVIIGYKKGLINVIFNICAFLLAIVITIILYKPVSNLIIKNTGIDKKIENIIIENFSADTTDSGETKYVGVIDYLEKYAKDTG